MKIHSFFLFFFGLSLIATVYSCGQEGRTGVDREIIHTDRAPEAMGPYSQAVRVGNTLYLSGQVGLVPETGELAEGGIEPQTRQAMQNIEAVLEEAGFAYRDVTEADIYLTDIGDYAVFNKIYASRFDRDPPARAVVEVANLPIEAIVEIKMTAVRTD